MAEAISVPLQHGTIDCISRTEAAKRLGISVRTLDRRTVPHGPIRPIRFGRRVLFPIAELDRYVVGELAASTDGGKR
ncbi:Helix-turn-helix domain protein [Rubripirellula obstinata]|uniref:Helix-turn-helix domain protein n=1 Tax=Rubripirellula obstinata TaxID=406547 RepID=A0A5B1CGN4_9BACT|nr:helix-turn-helix domain-containing protein [Rubripirellula obstinata]KAA1258364.1 Helix-turn-helix domain protein [Rubripirellula obstinata]